MLKLSTRGRYAARIMVYLAMREESAPARKQDIATAEDISGDYVEQILMRLRSAGLVESHRGARGGFTLARPAERISVADVLEATEGKLALAPCRATGCRRATGCSTRRVWERAEQAVREVLEQASIRQLADDARARRDSEGMTFHI